MTGPGLSSCVPPSLNSPWGIPQAYLRFSPTQSRAQSCLHPGLSTMDATLSSSSPSLCTDRKCLQRMTSCPIRRTHGLALQGLGISSPSQRSLPMGIFSAPEETRSFPPSVLLSCHHHPAAWWRPAGQRVLGDRPGGDPSITVDIPWGVSTQWAKLERAHENVPKTYGVCSAPPLPRPPVQPLASWIPGPGVCPADNPSGLLWQKEGHLYTGKQMSTMKSLKERRERGRERPSELLEFCA